MKVNWDHRLRDGFFYAMASGVNLLLLSFFYQIHTIHSQVFFVALLFPWWFLTVQAIRRLLPEFFGDLEYTVYKIKREEGKPKEAINLGDSIAQNMPSAQTSRERPPTSEDFWREQRAVPGSQSQKGESPISGLRIVPVSYPRQVNESTEQNARSRMLRDVLIEVSKPLPVARTLDGLRPSQEALIAIDVVNEKWQPLVDFARHAKQEAKSSCDLTLLRQVHDISVNCDVKSLLQPVCGISVIGDVSFVMAIQSKYGPIDFDGFCDAIALKDGARLPFEQGLRFEPSLDGALTAFFLKVVLPGHWAWGHGMYDRDQQLLTTAESAVAILLSDRISPENPELRSLTTPPGIRVSRRDDIIEVGCLAYWPGKGISDFVVTIQGGQLTKTQEHVLFHWGRGILY